MSRREDAAPSPDRRRFVRWLGLGGIAGMALGALGGLGAGPARAQATAPTTPVVTPPAATPATSAAPSEEAKALHAILTGRYGKNLDAAQSQSLLEALENTVQSGKALRAKTLPNSVEPDTVFHAVMPGQGPG